MSIKLEVPDLKSANAKSAVKHIMQKNISSTVLLGVTQGIGNIILATPLIKALTSMNLSVDILDGGFARGAEKALEGMMDVKIVSPEEAEKTIYLLGLQSLWPHPDVSKYVAQERCVLNIQKCWEDGIPAHEVEMNMSLAYSLGYKGDIPSLYCHYTPTGCLNQMGQKQIHIGIHVCRTYTHQFYMNRKLYDPLQIAVEIEKAGYSSVVVGHKDCVSEEKKKDYPISTCFMDGLSLSGTAGLIRELDAMINEDSGIMHVTAAMDIPQVAVFGPTSHIKNAPWNDKAIVLRKDSLACQPCQYTPNATTCTNNECMRIEPKTIVDHVTTLIEQFSKIT